MINTAEIFMSTVCTLHLVQVSRNKKLFLYFYLYNCTGVNQSEVKTTSKLGASGQKSLCHTDTDTAPAAHQPGVLTEENNGGDNYRRSAHNLLIRLEMRLFINKYLHCSF